MKIEWLSDDTLRIDGIWYEIEEEDSKTYIVMRDSSGWAHFLPMDHAVYRAMMAAA